MLWTHNIAWRKFYSCFLNIVKRGKGVETRNYLNISFSHNFCYWLQTSNRCQTKHKLPKLSKYITETRLPTGVREIGPTVFAMYPTTNMASIFQQQWCNFFKEQFLPPNSYHKNNSYYWTFQHVSFCLYIIF